MHRAGNVLYPLSELQAAVLAPQLDRLDERNARRRRAVALLAERLRDVPGLRLFGSRTDGEPCYYKVGFRYDAETLRPDAGALHGGRAGGGHRTGRGLPRPARRPVAGPLPPRRLAGGGGTRRMPAAVVLHHPVLLGSDEEVEQVAEAVRKVHRHAERLAAP